MTQWEVEMKPRADGHLLMHLRFFLLLLAVPLIFVGAHARNPELSTAPTWRVKAGDTLTTVAISRYGSGAYAGFLEKFNRVNPRKLHIDMQLATFDFSVAMEKCEAIAAAPKVASSLGKFADEFGTVSKLIKEARKDSSSLDKLLPMPEVTLDRLTKFQGQSMAVRTAVAESKSLKKSLDVRCGKIEELLKAITTFEKEQEGPFHSNGARSINFIHHQLDGILCELIDYTRRPHE